MFNRNGNHPFDTIRYDIKMEMWETTDIYRDVFKYSDRSHIDISKSPPKILCTDINVGIRERFTAQLMEIDCPIIQMLIVMALRVKDMLN